VPYAGEAAALATALFWSVTSIFFAEAGRRIGSFKVNKIRLLMAVFLYGTVLLITRGSPLPAAMGSAALYWLCLSSLIGLVIGDSLLFRAFVVIGPRLTTLIFASSPIMATVIAWFFLDEQLGPWDLVGIAVTIAGIIWVVAERREDPPSRALHEAHPDRASFRMGVLLAVGGALGQAAGLVASKEGMLGTGEVIDPFSASYVRILFAAVALWFWAALRGKLVETVRSATHGPAMLFTLSGAVFGPFLGIWMSLVAVTYIAAGVAATLIAMVPVMVIPLVIVFYKEKVSWRASVGAIVAVGGVALLFLM
jgi:drug/metabolite transporter (DMT)-like permease